MSRRLLLLLVLFIVAGLLLFVQLPIPATYAGRTVENAGHVPLFMLVTLGVMLVFRDMPRLAGARLYAFAGLVGIGAGFLSEVIQRPLRRDASWEDVFADALGAVCALAVYALFERRSALKRWHRVMALLVAIGCFAFYISPLVTMTRAYVHRNGQFPVLADFRSRIELYWTVSIGVRREIVGDAMKVEFFADDFPGISFHEPVPDWTGYKTLLIDVENPAAGPLDLGVRVHDKHHSRNKSFANRFNRRFELAAGKRRTLRISLEEVLHGPRIRLMDMQQISDITLFRGEKPGSRELLIHAMWLE